jgi:hypothetical protein
MMRRCSSLAICAVFALALGLIATTSAGAVTKAQLHSKALSLSNLPTGWTVDNSNSSNSSIGGGCLAGVKKLPRKKGAVQISVQYEDGQLPQLAELLAAGPGSLAGYNYLNHILEGCKHFTIFQSGRNVQVTVGAMSFPQYGNATSAYGLTFSVEGVNAGFDFVLFRVGSIVGLMEYGDIGQPDPDQLQTFMTAAVNKIEGKPTATPTTV